MNGSQEHPDVPTQRPTRPVAPPPAQPMQGAQPQPPVHQAVARRARGLQPKSPMVACLLSLMPGVGQIYVGTTGSVSSTTSCSRPRSCS